MTHSHCQEFEATEPTPGLTEDNPVTPGCVSHPSPTPPDAPNQTVKLKPFLCPCGQSFTAASSLKRHTMISKIHSRSMVNKSDEADDARYLSWDPVDCPVVGCHRRGRLGFNPKRRDNLRQHLRKVHKKVIAKKELWPTWVVNQNRLTDSSRNE